MRNQAYIDKLKAGIRALEEELRLAILSAAADPSPREVEDADNRFKTAATALDAGLAHWGVDDAASFAECADEARFDKVAEEARERRENPSVWSPSRQEFV